MWCLNQGFGLKLTQSLLFDQGKNGGDPIEPPLSVEEENETLPVNCIGIGKNSFIKYL